MLFSTISFALASALVAPSASAMTYIQNPTPLRTFSTAEHQCDITYNMSSPVMTNPLTIHYVYYGAWTDKQKLIVQDFTKGLGASAWYGITTQYYHQKNRKSPKVYISNNVTLGKTVNDTQYSVGKFIGDQTTISSIIQKLIIAKTIPEDTHALYVVLTSQDVSHSFDDRYGNRVGFCTHFCGYHASAVMQSGKRLAYVFVGNGAMCPRNYIAMVNHNASPNGDVGVDGLASMLAHEISEAVTDPYPEIAPAWVDCENEENADKCSWKYGSTTKVAKKYEYNMQISGRKFLIQQNWSLKTKSCALA